MINHVKDKSIVGCFCGAKRPALLNRSSLLNLSAALHSAENRRDLPLQRQIAYRRRHLPSSIPIFNLEIAELNTMKEHIHTGKIIGGGIFLLTEYLNGITYIGCTDEQRTGTACGVINVRKRLCPSVTISARIRLTSCGYRTHRLFTCTCCKLRNHIFVSIPKYVNLRSPRLLEVNPVEGCENTADKIVLSSTVLPSLSVPNQYRRRIRRKSSSLWPVCCLQFVSRQLSCGSIFSFAVDAVYDWSVNKNWGFNEITDIFRTSAS